MKLSVNLVNVKDVYVPVRAIPAIKKRQEKENNKTPSQKYFVFGTVDEPTEENPNDDPRGTHVNIII